jgi:hypothetical protein
LQPGRLRAYGRPGGSSLEVSLTQAIECTPRRSNIDSVAEHRSWRGSGRFVVQHLRMTRDTASGWRSLKLLSRSFAQGNGNNRHRRRNSRLDIRSSASPIAHSFPSVAYQSWLNRPLNQSILETLQAKPVGFSKLKNHTANQYHLSGH